MASDIGNQIITLKYYDAVESAKSNKREKDIRPIGVYKGGYLSKKDDTTAYLIPLVTEIQSKTFPYDQIRAETTVQVEVAVTSTNVYIVLRWEYTGVAAADYIELLGVSSPDTYDIIVGKCTYSGATLIGFTYADRTNPPVQSLFLKVEPEETPSMYVRIRGGRVQLGNQTVHIQDQLSSAFSAPGSGSKTGAVYIDSDGAIQVSSDFTQTGELVLAEIALIQSQTTIVMVDITDCRSFIGSAIIPDTTTIRFNSSTGKLEQVPHTHSQLHDEHTHTSIFGPRVGRSNGAVYLAATDGFVTAYNAPGGPYSEMKGYADTFTPPTTLRAGMASGDVNPGTIVFPVRKGEYWKTTLASWVSWMPISN